MRRHLLDFAACAGLVALAWVVLTPKPDTFALVAFDAAGSEYVLDTGLTLDDCERAAPYAINSAYEAINCELEASR